jgi:hypothetical protein
MYWIKTGQTLGTWSYDGGVPHGDNELTDGMLDHPVESRAQRFAYYAGGYSNGMWATEVIEP